MKGVLIRLNKLIEREKTVYYKEKPDPSSLGFGQYFTDYMFVMDYEEELDGIIQELRRTHRLRSIRLHLFFITARLFLKD